MSLSEVVNSSPNAHLEVANMLANVLPVSSQDSTTRHDSISDGDDIAHVTFCFYLIVLGSPLLKSAILCHVLRILDDVTRLMIEMC